MQPIKLYHYWRSSSSWRVRWAIALKGIPCDYVAVDLLNGESESPAHLSRHPLGYVPVLETKGLDGKPAYLVESLAIIDWLEHMVLSPSIFPGGVTQEAKAWHRAIVHSLAQIINADTQPLQNLTPQFLHSDDPVKRKAWAVHFITEGLKAYEITCRPHAGAFSFGDQVTLSDLCLIPQVYNALRNDIDLSQFPTIKRIYEHALTTDACVASHPDRFKPS